MGQEEMKEEFVKLKDAGNVDFKEGKWYEALENYTVALKFANNPSDESIIYKNKAAVFLKMNDYENVIAEATKALKINPNDQKALYRRAQAFEQMNRIEEAYKDARHVLMTDPGNKEIQPLLKRLYVKVQEKSTKKNDINSKTTEMFNCAFNTREKMDTRLIGMRNLLVLAQENSGAKVIYDGGVILKIRELTKLEKNELSLIGIRIISELCKNDVRRTREIISTLGVPWFFDLLNSNEVSWVNASQYCLQTILNSLSGLENKPDSSPDEKLCDENRTDIDAMLSCLVYACNKRTVSALARDAVLELITRNVHYKAIDWAQRLIEIKGLQKLMEIAAEIKEYKYESCIEITDSTKMLVALCLARIYENMYYDEAKRVYADNIDEFIKDKLLTPDMDSKVQVIAALTVLLHGPIDVGNSIIARDGIIDMIIVMASTKDILQQRIACECIIAAITKQDKAQMIVRKGIDILEYLFCNSTDDGIKVRALVGLCKLGSSSGTDASLRKLVDGSNKKLAEACRLFLQVGSNNDVKRWAAEGLSFLTLDAKVKEELIDDTRSLLSMIEVAKDGDISAVYGIVNTFVNLCNAYDKPEILPEMVELAKFAKRHVPETHEFDEEDFVTRRILILGKLGITMGLVALSKVESDNCKELISRVFNALCSQERNRGIVVSQGGVKALLSMALHGTPMGMKQAAQALARIGITMNPEVAFPGQRCMEVIRPLLMLLLPECTALMSFEALMALCNLASLNDDIRTHIVKERGVGKIENLMYEDHLMLRRAATQCITNLVISSQVQEIYEGENDKLKFLYLLCGEDDIDTSKAAAGAIATLTCSSTKCCDKIITFDGWMDIFKLLVAHPDIEMSYRAVVILYNIMCRNKSNAELIMSTDLMEVLMALVVMENNENDRIKQKVREMANKCLECAESFGLIKRSTENNSNPE